MAHVEDTQIKDGQYKPGTLLSDGKWRVEVDSMGQVKAPADRLWRAQTQQRSTDHMWRVSLLAKSADKPLDREGATVLESVWLNTVMTEWSAR